MKLRLAIVGAGLITKASHLPAALGSARAEVTAIIDTSLDRAVALTNEFGIEAACFDNLDAAMKLFDAAIIATPNSSHAPIALACIAEGKSILIEKPLAITVSEGEAIVAAARSAGVKLAAGYSTRFRENVVFLKALLERGEFGRVSRFVNRFGSPGGWSPMSSYNLAKDVAGGGVLVVTGTHFLDRMLYFWGMPDDVSMLSDAHGGAEANCHCSFTYNSGLSGGAIFSKTAALPAGTVMDTEAGYVLLGEFDDSAIRLRPHGSKDVEQVVQQRGGSRPSLGANSFDMQMDDFVSACLDDHEPMVGGDEALQSLRLIESLYESSKPLTEDWHSRAVVS